MIQKETEAEILRLFHADKWRVGTIADQLGVHHTTVQRVLKQAGVEPKSIAPRPSMADAFVPFIAAQLEKYSGLCASRLFEMVKARGYPGGPDHSGASSVSIGLVNPPTRFSTSRRCRQAVPSSQAFLRCLAERGENLGSNTSRLLQLLDSRR